MQSFIISQKTGFPKLTYYINVIYIKMYNQMQKLMNTYLDCCVLNLLLQTEQTEHQIKAITTANSHITRLDNNNLHLLKTVRLF